jgi:hypothetical protein
LLLFWRGDHPSLSLFSMTPLSFCKITRREIS